MRGRASLFLLDVLVTLLAVQTALQAHAVNIPSPEPPPAIHETTGTVRFDLYLGYFIVAHGSAGPLKNLNFFVDTGTTPAVLDTRIAKKLALAAQESTPIAALGGAAQGEITSLPSLELGPLTRSNLPVVTTDLSFFEKFVPVHIDAIVGLDVLGPAPFVIDYAAREIRFGPARQLPVSVPLRLDHGLAVFDVAIDHQLKHLLLDTGAGSLIVFTPQPSQAPAAKAATVALHSIGDFDGKQVWLHSVRLGSREFRQRSAVMTRNPKPSQLDYDGLISPAVLGISQVSVDLKGGVLGFSR